MAARQSALMALVPAAFRPWFPALCPALAALARVLFLAQDSAEEPAVCHAQEEADRGRAQTDDQHEAFAGRR